jgi:hypothetical protein
MHGATARDRSQNQRAARVARSFCAERLASDSPARAEDAMRRLRGNGVVTGAGTG